MTTLLVDPAPVLVTIPNVELASVGDWDASTGPLTIEADHLRAAIAALDDPAVHAPRLRIGHTSPSITADESSGGFSEQPCFGRFENLRLDETGNTLVADAVGVPAWLAEILPSAFPSRSLEGYWNVSTSTGRKHDFVITSVALLGVSMPAVETLEDLRLAYGTETPDGVEFVSGDRVAATRGETMPKRVSASVTYTDVRQSFYENVATGDADRYWWWVCDFIMSPSTVIADDDEGGLWSVPYTIKGDSITWGDPVEVRIQYVEADSGKVAASRTRSEGATAFATAAESRPIDRVRAANDDKGETVPPIAPPAVLTRLGLSEDATEEQMLAKLEASNDDAENDDEDQATENDDETEETDEDDPSDESDDVETKLLKHSNEQLAKRVETLEREAAERAGKENKARRDTVVAEAIKDGRIMASEHDMYRENLDINEAAALKVLASLPKGRVPISERGQSPAPQTGVELEWPSQFRVSTTDTRSAA